MIKKDDRLEFVERAKKIRKKDEELLVELDLEDSYLDN